MKAKRAVLVVLTVLMLLSTLSATAFAASKVKVTYENSNKSYNAAATTGSELYDDNDPINRVFTVKSGKDKGTRKLTFKPKAGTLEYYMYKVSTKECKQYYRIFVYNDDTNKGKTYYSKWTTKSLDIPLDKNTNYTVIVYPADYDTVEDKYLSKDVAGLKLKPIVYGYKKSPSFSWSTEAYIYYDSKGSEKIAA